MSVMIGLFCTFLVHVSVIPNLQKRCETDAVRLMPREDSSSLEVSINLPSNRNWQTKVCDSWTVTQPNFLHQKSVEYLRLVLFLVCLVSQQDLLCIKI